VGLDWIRELVQPHLEERRDRLDHGLHLGVTHHDVERCKEAFVKAAKGLETRIPSGFYKGCKTANRKPSQALSQATGPTE
jgi:hypothetical protein